MAMNAERSSKAAPLHNFRMPCDLRWGNQRFLRCMRDNADARISPLHRVSTTAAASHSSAHHDLYHSIGAGHRRCGTADGERRDSQPDGSRKMGSTTPLPLADHGIAAVREKVMLDLQTAAGEMKNAIFGKGLEDGQASSVDAAAESIQGEKQRPWSLRTRRASYKTLSLGENFAAGNGRCEVTGSDGGKGNRPAVDAGIHRLGIPRSNPEATAAAAVGKSPSPTNDEKPERAKFSVAISKRAIEEDFYAMLGHRPPRRPKKRAKTIQKYLDTMFPGLWLTEITPEMYKITEPAP